MLDYLSTANTLFTRTITYAPQEYLFVLQVVLGEQVEVAYGNVYDVANFKKNVPSEEENDYLATLRRDALNLLDTQECQHLRKEIEEQYRADIQSAASTLKEYRFSSEDVQKLLAGLLHDRTQDLSESSVRDILALIKTMYENGSLDSGDTFQHHFISVPNKYNALCASCNHEMYAIEGLNIRCEHCGAVYRWSEEERRFYPEIQSL